MCLKKFFNGFLKTRDTVTKKKGNWRHKLPVHLLLLMSLVLSFFAPSFVLDSGADETTQQRHTGLSETGVTHVEEAPFSKESIDDIKENETRQPAHVPEQRVIPFHEISPIELMAPTGQEKKLSIKPQSLVPQGYTAASLAPTLSNNFTGLSDNNTSIPPDTNGAVGPSHIVETLNTEVAFFSKATGTLISKVSLQAFWQSLGTGTGQPAERPFDPKVIYDQHSGRFIVVTMGMGASPTDSWLMIAVSATSDPTGTWYKWAVDADKDAGVQMYSNWADYPGVGIDATYLYVTANMFTSGGAYQYPKVWVMPKPQLLNGQAAITVTEFRSPTGSGFTMQPAHVFGTSSTEYLVHGDIYITGLSPRQFLAINSITFPSGTPTWTNLGYIEVASYPYNTMPGAPQSGSSQTIHTGDHRLLNAVYRNGYLYTAHTVANDANTKTEAAWYQLNPASASQTSPYGTPVQQGRISDTTRWYYYPSIAVNSNDDVAIGFSGSSASEYAGAYYTARQASDAAGTMQSVALLKGGEASYYKTGSNTKNRWGDYSATIIDPTDDLTFWTLQEYSGTSVGGYDRWGTWWGTFTTATAPPTCTYSISPTIQTFTSTGGTGSVTVTASGSSCTWTATSALSWVTITTGSGTGSGTASFSVAANTTGAARTGNITIAGQTFAITQSGASCVYTLFPANQAFDAFGGTGSVNVSTSASSCIWTATSSVSWATITSSANGTGNGTVTYSISSSVGTDRTGSITIAGQTFIITQTGSVINTMTNLVVNPGFESGYANWYGVISRPTSIIDSSPVPHAGSRYAWLGGYNGASDYIYQDVIIPSSAQQPYFQFWYSISTWETTTSVVYDTMAVEIRRPADNALLGTAITLSNLNKTSGWVPSLLYDLSAFKGQGIRLRFYATTDSWSNPSNFRIDDVSLNNTVTTACTFSISPISQIFTSTGGTGSVSVSALPSGCAWTASSSLSWVTITSGSGTGNGTASFTVAANTSTSSRTGTITIAGHTFTITQSGIVCTYTISPTSQTFTSTGGTGSVAVTASDSSCAWTTLNPLTWATITSGSNGTGNGIVTFSVAANTGGPRTGNITIAGQTYAITQAAACIYIISPTSQTFNSSAGMGSVAVTASDSSCAWTTLNPLTWATITSGSSGTGNGIVTFSVSENTTGASRTGNITIAGQTFTITQSATQPVSLVISTPSSQSYFDTIQAAYDANTATSGSTILAQGVTLTENLLFNQNNSITLTGGYDSSFSSVGGTMTTVLGSLTISGGTVTVANLVIQ